MDLYFVENIKNLFLEYIYYIIFFSIILLLVILNAKSNAYKRKKEMQINLKSNQPARKNNKKNVKITKSKLIFEGNIFLLNDKLKFYNMSDGKKEVKDPNFIVILLEDKLEQKGFLNKLEREAYNKYYELIKVVSPINYSNQGTFENEDDNDSAIDEKNIIYAPQKTIYDDDIYEFGGERLD